MPLWSALRLEALFIIALLLPLLVQLGTLYLVSRALWALSGRTVGRAGWLLLALVGVPVHELSHAAAFWLTGAGVQRLVLFAPRGLPEYGGATGVVVPARPPSTLSRLIASIAPFFGCSFAAWLVLSALLPEFVISSDVPAVSLNGALGPAASSVLSSYLSGLAAAISQLNWGEWQTFLAVYLGASLGMGAAPSTEDLKRFFPALIVLLVLLVPVFAVLQAVAQPDAVLTAAQRVLSQVLLPVGAALTYATLFALLILGVLLVLSPLTARRRG